MVLEGGVFLFSRQILPSFTTLILPYMTLKLLSTHPAHITTKNTTICRLYLVMHVHFAAVPTKFMHFCSGLYFLVSLARLAWLGFGARGDFIRRRTRWPDSRALLYAWASAPRIIFQSAALAELDRSGAPLTVEHICDGQRDKRVRQLRKVDRLPSFSSQSKIFLCIHYPLQPWQQIAMWHQLHFCLSLPGP